MYDKSRITAIMLCLIMLFQVQTYAAPSKTVEETATHKLTNQNMVEFDGTSGDTMLKNDDTILYKPANADRGNYVKITLPKGKYKLECYGSKSKSGVKGGYSSGTYETKKLVDLYLYCGGSNGYNGGGDSAGGATHIATKIGQLKERKADYKSSLIMVAGGAGAGAGGTGVGGGLSGGKGGGRADGGGIPNVSISGKMNEAIGGTQESGGAGGVSVAGGAVKSGKSGSFGQGGTGTYGGGGGFYGGGSGAGTVSTSRWVNTGGGDYTCIAAESTTYGAGGSGFINSDFITDTATEQGKNTEAGKIRITCLEVRHDYYTNTLHAPNQVVSGSTFTVHSESEFNSNYRDITEVKYRIKSSEEVLLEKEAELASSTSEGNVVKKGYSKQLKMPDCQASEVNLEMVITYDDGETVTLSQVISLVGAGKERYSDEIRYVGQGFKLDDKSKWMTNKKLYDELSNSINKTEPEEVRNLK